MSFLGFGRPQPSSAEKIAAVEAEMKLMADMMNRYAVAQARAQTPFSFLPQLTHPLAPFVTRANHRPPVSTRPARRSASPTTTSRARSTRARQSASTGAPPSSSTSTSRSRTYYSRSSSSRWAAAGSADKRVTDSSPWGISRGPREGGIEPGLSLSARRKEAQAWRADTACSMGRVTAFDFRPEKDHSWKPIHRTLETRRMNQQTVQTPKGVRQRSMVATARCF